MKRGGVKRGGVKRGVKREVWEAVQGAIARPPSLWCAVGAHRPSHHALHPPQRCGLSILTHRPCFPGCPCLRACEPGAASGRRLSQPGVRGVEWRQAALLRARDGDVVLTVDHEDLRPQGAGAQSGEEWWWR